jgi:flagellar hook-associated protein 3 FlgL
VSELSALQDRLSMNVGQVGSSLNNLERQIDINASTRLRIDELLSTERDLDYAKAVTEFNAEMVRLEATQASFAKIAQLSLFEYL